MYFDKRILLVATLLLSVAIPAFGDERSLAKAIQPDEDERCEDCVIDADRTGKEQKRYGKYKKLLGRSQNTPGLLATGGLNLGKEPDWGVCLAEESSGSIRALRGESEHRDLQDLSIGLSRYRWRSYEICVVGKAADVVEYRVRCPSSAILDFQISDCCIAGDHFQLKGKNWDTKPNTGVTTSPGPRYNFGLVSRVYNYGTGIDAYVQCSYLHGVNIFPAGAYVRFFSDSSCKVEQFLKSDRIDRTP